jgi:ferredoxin
MIKVDKNKCIGCGLCVSMCPKTFKMNADNISEPISQVDKDCAKNAAAACPVKAISIN